MYDTKIHGERTSIGPVQEEEDEKEHLRSVPFTTRPHLNFNIQRVRIKGNFPFIPGKLRISTRNKKLSLKD